MKKLLVCIPHHHGTPERMLYLTEVVNNLLSYPMEVKIIVNTNAEFLTKVFPVLDKRVTVVAHTALVHPFHLCWVSRQQIADNIDNYDYFYVVEDDMLLPWENFKNHIETFDILPFEYVPGLVRVEKGSDGKLYNTDATEPCSCRNGITRTHIDGSVSSYCALKFPYHAQWIMPQKALKESMRADFVRLDTNRELAASYPMWELNKTALVRLTEDNKVDPLCYTYHLPNNYALSPDSPFGKIEIDKILI